jgi:hypothetical protein
MRPPGGCRVVLASELAAAVSSEAAVRRLGVILESGRVAGWQIRVAGFVMAVAVLVMAGAESTGVPSEFAS